MGSSVNKPLRLFLLSPGGLFLGAVKKEKWSNGDSGKPENLEGLNGAATTQQL
jgi:hypothetical protein